MMDSNNNNDNNNVLLLLAAFTQHQQLSLLELLFSINQDPSDEALETIAQRINSTSQTVANWFQARREQFQVQQVAAAAAAAAASVTTSNNHLSNLVLNNLMLDPQQLQQQQLQQQLQQHHHHYQTISNASSSSPPTTTPTTTTIQQPIQLGALNATRTSLDSPIDQHSIQNNFSNLHHNNHHNNSGGNNNISSNHHHHHHHHHHNQTTQDNGQASSTLLAKLTAVTSNLAGPQQSAASIVVNPAGVGQMQQNHLMSGVNKLDGKMIDLLEALYAINDNPEMSAIEMISKRVDVPCHLISDWFDKKRMKLNPFAGHRSPPVNKKREGGRVVTFSEYQRSLLEAIFNENNYLHPQEYEELSKLIQVPSRNIKIWFKNRRSKQRLSSGGRTVNNIRC